MAERTEAPTPRRREEARRKGQVAKSAEINSAVILLVAFWMLSSVGPRLVDTLSSVMERSFGSLPTTDITPNTLRVGSLAIGGVLVQTIAPFALVLMLAGVIVNLGQVGFLFSQEALRPDPKRISPLNGMRRIFSGRGLVELIKSLLKLVVIGLVVYTTLRENHLTIATTSRMTLSAGISSLAQIGKLVGLRTAVVMVVIAAADYLFQRREFEKSLRMTRQELIEEMKRYENAQLKSRIRVRQRQLAMSRMMAAIPKADVVITNPTHIAVALQYDRETMGAPQVVAKGQRLVAERIKERAHDHKVPLVENKPLAQALFKSVEINQAIPLDLYQAVAEVLAFVYRMNK